jgi:predicted nucleic acid-binding protein
MIDVLLDTNVLIYALDRSSVFHKNAIPFFESNSYNLFTSTKSISEYFAVTSKLKLDFGICFGFYTEIRKNISILKPSEQSLDIFEKLIQKYKPQGNRVYDTEIVSIMLANNLKSIVTANTSDFKSIDEIQIIEINAV